MSDTSKPAAGVQKELGERIRSQRLALNMTLAEIANDTGLTGSTISQVERALISPSVSTLKKICDALKISIGELFGDREAAENGTEPGFSEVPQADSGLSPASASTALHRISPVVRKERRKFLSPNPGVRYYLLTPDMSGPLELIFNEIDPGAGTGPPSYTHPGVESGVILSGELEVQINSEVYTLKEGDSITFNSSEPHLLRNVSDLMCTCIWANTPPWF
jgi:transcriptional regulator with XRE-family HTH domain